MPIINPFFFYLCELIDGFKILGIVVGSVTAVCLGGIGLGVWLCRLVEDSPTLSLFRSKFILKVFSIITIISLLMGILLPSKQTMYLMKAAELTTYENVEATGDAAKEIFSYVLNSLQNEEVS